MFYKCYYERLALGLVINLGEGIQSVIRIIEKSKINFNYSSS